MTYPTIRPELTLDFANSRQLDPRITFSRTSGATYLNPDTGLITLASDHEARFEKEGLLIEESRINYIPNSIDFTGWSQVSGASIALSSAVAAPDGNTSSSLFTADDNTGYAQLPYAIPGDTTAYLTLFVKAASENVFQLSSSRSATMRGLFDMTTGLWSSTAGSADDYAAEAYPNGWWKLTVKGFISAPNTIALYVLGPNITSTGTDAFCLWGAQVEHGDFPSSYIPTTGSTVTRAVDIAQITGDNFSSWYNDAEGTFNVTYNSQYSSPQIAVVALHDGTNSNRISFRPRNSFGQSSGVNQFNVGLSAGDTPPNVQDTIGLSVDSFGAYLVNKNGSDSDITSVTMPVGLNRLDIGKVENSNGYLNGHLSRLAYYSRRLTDLELQTITL